MLGACIELCRVLGNLLSNAAQVKRETKSLAPAYAVGSLICLLFIYFAGMLQVEIVWACFALTLGAVAMLVTMLMNMYKQIRFRLDAKRCTASIIAMLAMVVLVSLIPKVFGLVEAIMMMILAIFLMSIAVFALLWKNPATLRLLNVQLRGG